MNQQTLARWIVFRHSLRSRMRRCITQFYRYRIAIIPAKQIPEIKDQPEFIKALQLQRIANTLVSVQRSYLKIPNSGSLPDTKDRIELIHLIASFVYEAVDAFLDNSKLLKKMQTWSAYSSDIKTLQSEKNEWDSFRNTVLKAIRNEVLFHFSKTAIEGALTGWNTNQDIVIAAGKTTSTKDVVFRFVDDLLLNHIVNKMSIGKSDMEKYEEFERRLLSLSKALISLSSKLSAELLKDYVKHEKRKLRE